MRALYGVCRFDWRDLPELKRQALLFDKFYTTFLGFELFGLLGGPIPSSIAADIEYLRSLNVIVDSLSILRAKFSSVDDPKSEVSKDLILETQANDLEEDVLQSFWELLDAIKEMNEVQKNRLAVRMKAKSYDMAVRELSTSLGDYKAELGDVVPICQNGLPEYLNNSGSANNSCRTVLGVTLEAFPVPDESCSWQDILDFKKENCDKLWGLRRFLSTLATKDQTESEIRDDIEWTLNEYTKAMKLHHLKAGNSFIEVYVLPVIELAEDLAKFNWSKIAKGVLSVKKRQVELMEAEMKAPGRECAYVFEAQKKFGQPR